MDIEKLKEALQKVEEPRRTSHGNIRHKLEDIIIIGLCTIICCGEDYADMEEFGKERQEWLSTILELPNGIPDSDTFRRVFERLNPQELSKSLVNWLDVEREKRAVIAIDGKTIRGSKNETHKAYHVVSAFVAENQITLGEITVTEKSNEITAVPELLDLIDVEGAIVTADAMSCQKKIVQKLSEKQADYVLGLKENQRNLYEDVRLFFESCDNVYESKTTIAKDHGRIEKRHYRLLTDISWLCQKDEWENICAVGAVTSMIEEKERTSTFTRYFITSLQDVDTFAYAVRKHWAIKNHLHWCLDVIFREDNSRARKDFSPLNMNILRKISLSLVNQAKQGRLSKKKMMFKAALNPEVLLRILFSL